MPRTRVESLDTGTQKHFKNFIHLQWQQLIRTKKTRKRTSGAVGDPKGFSLTEIFSATPKQGRNRTLSKPATIESLRSPTDHVEPIPHHFLEVSRVISAPLGSPLTISCPAYLLVKFILQLFWNLLISNIDILLGKNCV